jgi:hypothetical protein
MVRVAVDQVMHAPTEIVRVELSDVRSMLQSYQPDQGNYLVTS